MTELMNVLSIFPMWLLVVMVAVISVIGSWLTVVVVRRMWPHPHLIENNEFVGFTYAVFGLIYGVLLAFTIVTAWQRFSEAERVVITETTILSELWRDAQGLPKAVREDIHRDLMLYVESVISNEWKELAANGRSDATTKALYEELWENSYLIQPTTPSEEAFLAEYLGRINALSAERRMRILFSRSEVHPILWWVIMTGALLTISYALFFATKHGWIHILITSYITFLIMICLLVVFSLQYPFTGNVSVTPTPYVILKEAYEQRMAEAKQREAAQPQPPTAKQENGQ